jgi:transposase
MSEKHLGKLTVSEFFARFPDDDACLTHIMEVRYGLRHECENCGKYRTFHKVKGRPAFNCAECRSQVYPCSGTIFQDSRTPLRVWFYAIFLFVTTRHGVSGKELERTLGVTYKTAYRMGMQIRKLMARADGFAMLKGHVELDEAYIGGRRSGRRGRGADNKTVVMGLQEREGRFVAETIPNAKTPTLREVVLRNVEKGSAVSTDEWAAYYLLKKEGYDHKTVNHSRGEWRTYNYRRDEYHHTNHVENFWRLFLREFTFRSNHRAMQNAMFDLLIASV